MLILLLLGMVAFAGIFAGIYILVDYLLTLKRLAITQHEWDEYSKEMSNQEKMECFNEFLIQQKIKHGWNSMYIPYWNRKRK